MLNKNSIYQYSGFVFIICGLLFALVALYFGMTPAGQPAPNILTVKETFFIFLLNLGIAVAIIGVVNILVDMRGWQSYFEDRIKNVILDSAHLNNLNPNELDIIVQKAWQAKFGDSAISNRGGFLEYFNDNLNNFVAAPFRDDVSTEIMIEEKDSEHFSVQDKVTYKCRAIKDRIQSKISWIPDEDEYVSSSLAHVRIRFPYNHEKAGEVLELKVNWNNGFDHSISEYETIDGLQIEILVNYTVKKHKFLFWTMAHPTKNFEATVIYPKNYQMHARPFVLTSKIVAMTEWPGYLKIVHSSWALPGSGLAWILSPLTNTANPVTIDSSEGQVAKDKETTTFVEN